MIQGPMIQDRASQPGSGRQDLISVVMANYCGADYLPAAMESVLRQTHSNIELIVSDDASPDRSREIVQEFAEGDPRVILISVAENRGPAAMRNRALAVARGEWIAIVDSDDIIHPERFETLLAAADALHADAVADDMIFFSEAGPDNSTTLLGPMAGGGPHEISLEYFIRSNTSGTGLPPLGYLKPVFRKEAIAGLLYDEAIRVGEDYDFLLRFLLGGRRFFLLPEPRYLYRRHDASISHRLSEEKVLGMIANQERLLAGRPALPPGVDKLLDRRMAGLRQAALFERLVASLKQRRVAGAMAILAANPRLTVPLCRSMADHLQGRRRSRQGEQRGLNVARGQERRT